MALFSYYAPGDNNAVCYECGHKFKASQLRKHWQGYWVCPQHWEPRHPQDFVRAPTEHPTVSWAQPASDQYIYACDPIGSCGVVGYAITGCAVVGKPYPFSR